MSSVTRDHDDRHPCPKFRGDTPTSRTSRISSSGHEESLAGMYFIADCDDDDLGNARFESDGIAEKRGTGSIAESTTVDGINKNSRSIIKKRQQQQIEQEVLAKQQGRSPSNAAMRDNRASKTRLASTAPYMERAPLVYDTAFGTQVDTRKENQRSTGNIPKELQRLENDLDEKVRQNKLSTPPTESRATHTKLLQDDIEAKRRISGRPYTLSEEISRLDARIAARNSKVRLASKRNVRATEQDSIETPIISNVGHNPGTSTTVKPLKREGSTSTMVEQYQTNIKLDTDKDEMVPNSAMYSGLDCGAPSYGLIANASTDDLEYGVYDDDDGPHSSNPNAHKGLAVAFAVQEDGEDMYIPSAVEFDPDAKPPAYKNRRFRLYACLVIIVVIVGTITASVGITLTQPSQQSNTGNIVPGEELPYRATLGIRDSIERIVGGEKLDDINSPYRKALDWIQDVDPLTLTPNDENFLQRYLAVYFYYATSIKHPWSGGCNPPVNGEDESCLYKRLSSLDPVTYTDIPWQRWLTKQFECNWAGIYCDDAGQIRSLEFSGINMTGTFPEGIVGFSFLQSLTLSFGELEGPLPDVLVNMKHLVNIELQGNLFTGTIPSAWYKSRSIQRINLSINQISGSISPEMSQVKDMKGIFIYENSITGNLPTEIGLMRSLSFFRINRNFLQGSIPSDIGNLQLLYDIWIQRNAFSGPIPTEFGLLNDLTDFRAQGNLLSGNVPEEFYEMPSIRRVDMFENRFNGTLSPSISKLSLLDQFRINDNRFSGVIPTEMGSMTNLASFVASGNAFVGVVPEELCNLRLQDFGTYFIELQTDCSVPKYGDPEILCPQTCCTHCCDVNGTICIPNA